MLDHPFGLYPLEYQKGDTKINQIPNFSISSWDVRDEDLTLAALMKLVLRFTLLPLYSNEDRTFSIVRAK